MRAFRVILASAAILSAAQTLFVVEAAAAEGRFDGRWTIDVSATGAVCPVSRQHLVAVISGNRLVQLSGVSASGGVSANGGFNATFVKMGESAHAGGQLGERSGAGSWASASRICSGVWRAQRITVVGAR